MIKGKVAGVAVRELRRSTPKPRNALCRGHSCRTPSLARSVGSSSPRQGLPRAVHSPSGGVSWIACKGRARNGAWRGFDRPSGAEWRCRFCLGCLFCKTALCFTTCSSCASAPSRLLLRLSFPRRRIRPRPRPLGQPPASAPALRPRQRVAYFGRCPSFALGYFSLAQLHVLCPPLTDRCGEHPSILCNWLTKVDHHVERTTVGDFCSLKVVFHSPLRSAGTWGPLLCVILTGFVLP